MRSSRSEASPTCSGFAEGSGSAHTRADAARVAERTRTADPRATSLLIVGLPRGSCRLNGARRRPSYVVIAARCQGVSRLVDHLAALDRRDALGQEAHPVDVRLRHQYREAGLRRLKGADDLGPAGG